MNTLQESKITSLDDDVWLVNYVVLESSISAELENIIHSDLDDLEKAYQMSLVRAKFKQELEQMGPSPDVHFSSEKYDQATRELGWNEDATPDEMEWYEAYFSIESDHYAKAIEILVEPNLSDSEKADAINLLYLETKAKLDDLGDCPYTGYNHPAGGLLEHVNEYLDTASQEIEFQINEAEMQVDDQFVFTFKMKEPLDPAFEGRDSDLTLVDRAVAEAVDALVAENETRDLPTPVEFESQNTLASSYFDYE